MQGRIVLFFGFSLFLFSNAVFAQQNVETAAENLSESQKGGKGVFWEKISDFFGGGAKVASREGSKAGKALIKGRLVMLDSGIPLRNVPIRLVSAKNGKYQPGLMGMLRNSGVGAKSDSRGEFVLSGIPPGDYYPVIDAANLITTAQYNISQAKTKAEILNEASRIGEEGEYHFTFFAKKLGSISGRITYQDGSPAAGLIVEVLPKPKKIEKNIAKAEKEKDNALLTPEINMRASANMAIADDEGNFRVIGLRQGEYYLAVNEPSSFIGAKPPGIIEELLESGDQSENHSTFKTDFKTYFPGSRVISEAQEIRINEGMEQSGFNFSLKDKNLYKIIGKALAKESREPLAGFQVKLIKVEKDKKEKMGKSEEGASILGKTDPNGNILISDIPEGKYKIVVSKPEASQDDRLMPRIFGRDDNNVAVSPGNFKPAFREFEILDKNISDLIIELEQIRIEDKPGEIGVNDKEIINNKK